MSDIRTDIRDLIALADHHARISREAAGAAGRLLAEIKDTCTGASAWREELDKIGIEMSRARVLMMAARTSA